MIEQEFAIFELESQIKNLETENKNIRKEIYSNKKARIIIRDMVYPGVALVAFDSQFVVENALVGPMVAEIDPVTGEIGLSSNFKEDEE